MRTSDREHRRRNTRSGTVDEMAHTPGFRTLHGYQAFLTTDVIVILKARNLSLVAVCVLLETFDSIFN